VARPVDTEPLKSIVRSRLLSADREGLEALTHPEQRLRVREEVLAVLRERRAILPSRAVTEVANQVSDEVVGLGPVERLLKDPEVSEVMVNGADDIYVERKGRIERVEGLLFEGIGWSAASRVGHPEGRADRPTDRGVTARRAATIRA
jgi:pilus assembly protein CpaF